MDHICLLNKQFQVNNRKVTAADVQDDLRLTMDFVFSLLYLFKPGKMRIT